MTDTQAAPAAPAPTPVVRTPRQNTELIRSRQSREQTLQELLQQFGARGCKAEEIDRLTILELDPESTVESITTNTGFVRIWHGWQKDPPADLVMFRTRTPRIVSFGLHNGLYVGGGAKISSLITPHEIGLHFLPEDIPTADIVDGERRFDGLIAIIKGLE